MNIELLINSSVAAIVLYRRYCVIVHFKPMPFYTNRALF